MARLAKERVLVWPGATPPGRAVADRAAGPRRIAVLFLGVLLAFLTVTTFVACYYAIVIVQQLDEGEPVIYGLVSRILQNQPLYQATDHQPFIQVYYTPLYFFALAKLETQFGPGFATGRALSLAAGLVAAALVGYLAASRARSFWAGAFAVLLFLGLGFPGGPAPFLALERVDVLGVALSVAAIAVLGHRTTWYHVVAAGVLAGLAVMTKQTLIAAGLAGTLWLATVCPRKAVIFVAVSALTVLAPAAVFQWSSAGAFWNNVGPANLTPTSLPTGAALFHELVVLQGVPALLAALYVVKTRAWRRPTARLIVLYWLATLISVAGIVKVGANHNYWIEFAAATAVLASLAVWRCLGYAPRRPSHAVASMVPVLLLAVQLGALVPARVLDDRNFTIIPFSWTLLLDQFHRLSSDSETSEFNLLVRDVGGEQPPVLTESMDIAALANQPLQLEPFAFSMLERQGRWNSAPLVNDICNGKITLLILSYPIELNPTSAGIEEFPSWPRSVMTALREAMQFEQIRAFHWLYRSAAGRDAAAIEQCKANAAAAAAAP